MVACPICGRVVRESAINQHIDSGCKSFVVEDESRLPPPSGAFFQPLAKRSNASNGSSAKNKTQIAPAASQSTPKSSSPNTSTPKNTTAPKPSSPVAAPENNGKRPPPDVIDDPEPTPKRKQTAKNAILSSMPLAERMRPRSLSDVIGQSLIGPSGLLRGLIDTKRVPSLILWGSPGTGKTTIARLIASTAGYRFVEINSSSSNVAEVKKLFSEARAELGLTGRKTLLFCDEIHRFSKTQQDVFLGPVEAGSITLVGATTENPSFKLVNALLSRCRVFTLAPLTEGDIVSILRRALASECPKPPPLIDDAFLSYLASSASGDARTALNLLELSLSLASQPSTTLSSLKTALTQTHIYDRAGDAHYDLISAFHKSIRGSSPDAALYYLARMLAGGEDPLFIARRLIVVASEDVGMADCSLLPLCVAAHDTVMKIGLPEARIALAHATVATALAKKSTRVYRALNAAMAVVEGEGRDLPVPVHLRNAPTRLMKELGYGQEYKYNPDFVDGRVKQEYLPEKLVGRVFLEERDLGTKVDP
ncbi:P-loop containing nucleoside triphosphate hydrolase protein [Trichodelitschia bisporula]|uniref:P-loop containing nucleoside triphosphate hydrolase protein n=1 Tax=Trichodelitschia bisporula TaxID=703511 RepID=A0A6G1I9C3_9PEZI|nr:P-loop containing nucleoside triphosphate hydrolase protein [Trichodelitschia bisporula]